MAGQDTKSNINVTVSNYFREFNFDGNVFSVIQINQGYRSDIVSGFVGIGPYTAINNENPDAAHVYSGQNFISEL